MKLAIWSDLHVGCRMYRTDENNINKYEQAIYKALEDYAEVMINENPDLIIDSGDVFDKANPSVLAMNKYARIQQRFERLDIPTMTILGNHDFSFPNRRSKCSAAAMAYHTYFADYDIKSVDIDNIQFVMMPYIYDKDENIEAYLKKCEEVAKSNPLTKKVLVTHGVTEKYYKDSFVGDKIMLSDELVSLFNLVIIGHIHTSFAYKQGNTLVLSPGGLIDYQSYKDSTGPCFVDTDTWQLKKIKVTTPHIIKVDCNEKNINETLKNVTYNIYQITYKGDTSKIDNDLFIEAKNKTLNLTINPIADEVVETKKVKKTALDIITWVSQNYPDKVDLFIKAKEATM